MRPPFNCTMRQQRTTLRAAAMATCLLVLKAAPVLDDDRGPADGCAQGSEHESFWQRLADS
jgi:hypothetical protein